MKIDGTRRQDRATELVLSYYAAFNRGDWEGMLAMLTDDVVHDLNQGARETGREAFAAFLGRMSASYREQLRDIVVMVTQDGQHAAAEYIVQGEYHHTDEGLPPANGQTYVLPGGAFFDIRDDRIARVTNYYNLQDWVRQVRRDSP
nr:ketosteroid isomerase-related protein [uncultured Pseudoxanthomonas sp.]